ncbi:MAG: SprT-like domain-containing protein [Deltaproteobacteria bacterium]|nr:SprT-like domain-containing protein [Deltaproteobacteria bacterium]
MSQTVGKTYDLQSLYERLNRLYFDNSLVTHLRWSARSAPRARRRVILGSYRKESNTITLSRRLDSPRVPLYFVEHVLFHEMLHAVFPSEKHKMHTEKFKKFERMHPDYDRAREWEKNSIQILFEKAQISLPLSAQGMPQKKLSFSQRVKKIMGALR